MPSLHYNSGQSVTQIAETDQITIFFDDKLTYLGSPLPPHHAFSYDAKVLESALFLGKFGSICALPGSAMQLNVATIICVGVGDLGLLTVSRCLDLGGLIGKYHRNNHIYEGRIFPPHQHFSQAQQRDFTCALSKGFWLGCYTFDALKTKKQKKSTEFTLSLYHAQISAWDNHIQSVYHDVLGQCFAKDLMHLPPNILYPSAFVEKIIELEKYGLEIEIFDETELQKQSMHALLAVGQGSSKPPRLAIMRWSGNKSSEKPVVLVGKGICYDSGGLNLKTAMQVDMKYDMGGAAAVVGTMKSVALNQYSHPVIGIVALAENMPDGNAYRPSDVISSRAGLSINILNTDAEGRLALADALDYAVKECNPKAIIDLATLTGAMLVSLGHTYAGFFTRDDNLAHNLTQAGILGCEKLWRMPLDDQYDKMIDSPIADVANLGQPSVAGSITAAQFLARFVQKDIPWAHIDIAGTAWLPSPTSTHDKGPTGFGVSLLLEYLTGLTRESDYAK